MKSRSKVLLIASFAAAFLILTLVLYFRYEDVLRIRVLRPVIESYYIGRYYLQFVPQLALWLLPLLLSAAILLRRGLRRDHRQRRPRLRRPDHALSPGMGELAHLTHQLRRAHYSRFARVRVSRTMVEIAARLIAGREAIPLASARHRLLDGYWQSAPVVHRFLTPRRHYTARQSGQEFDRALIQTVAHLETFDQHGGAPGDDSC